MYAVFINMCFHVLFTDHTHPPHFVLFMLLPMVMVVNYATITTFSVQLYSCYICFN